MARHSIKVVIYDMCVAFVVFFPPLSSIRGREARPDNSWQMAFSVKNVSCHAVGRSYFSGFFFNKAVILFLTELH